jgi:2-aminoethylphosphonate-pyruvate transaminase
MRTVRDPDQKMLFTPGPVMTTPATKAALSHIDMAHRRPAFERVFKSARARLKTLLGANDEYACVVVTGSGSAANETALSSIVRPTEEVLLVSNGPFGERLEEMLTCYGARLHKLQSPWGVLPDLDHAEHILKANKKIAWVVVVWHETGASLINPVAALGALAHRHGRRLFADCVSAFGGEDINVVRDNVDVCTGVGSKCVGAMPGVSFVAARRSAVPQLGPDMPRRNIYMNLQTLMQWADGKDQTPNTPAVTLVIGLDHALGELLEEGLPRRIERYRACSRVIRDGAKALGLRLLVPEEHMATMVTSMYLPPGINVDGFIDALDERGYVVYPGKSIFHDQNVFQVANMGALTPEDCRVLVAVMGETLQAMRDGVRLPRVAVTQESAA